MTDYNAPDWNEVSAENTGLAPNGVQGGYAPSTVAPILRELRGAAKRNFVRQNPIYTTTGTGSAYLLTYLVGPAGYVKGEIFRVWAHADCAASPTISINGLGAKQILGSRGQALAAGAIKANDPIELVYDGASFRLVSNQLSNLALSGALTVASNGSTLSVQRNAADSIDIEAFNSANTATKNALHLNRFGGAVTVGGSNVVTDNGGTYLINITGNANTLDGQDSAFFRNASNMNAGTLPSARLSGTYNINVNGTSGNSNQLGGRASAAIWDDSVNNWKRSSEDIVRLQFVNGTRTIVAGQADGNGFVTTFHQHGVGDFAHFGTDGNLWMKRYGDWISNVIDAKQTRDGRTYPRRVGGGDLNFNWSGQGGQPTWLWGGNDGTNMYVYNPANFSVNYATSAGRSDTCERSNNSNNADRLGGRNSGNIWDNSVENWKVDNGGRERFFYQNGSATYLRGYSDTIMIFRNGDANNASRIRGGGSYEVLSDRRTKYDIRDADNVGLTQLLNMRPVRFKRNGIDKDELGWISQEVREALPDAVNPVDPNDPDELWFVNSDAIVVNLVAAVKELSAEVTALKTAQAS